MGFRQRRKRAELASRIEGGIERTRATVARHRATLDKLEGSYDREVAEARTPEEADAVRVQREEALAGHRREARELERGLTLMEGKAKARGLRVA